MALDHTQLRDYLTADPAGLGLVSLWPLHDDSAVAAALNDPARGQPVPAPAVPKGTILGVLVRVLTLDPAVQARWDRPIQMLQAADDEISLTGPVGQSLAAVFKLAVTDGLLTDDEVTALTSRPGSPAEVAFGVGVVVTAAEVSAAVPAEVQAQRDKDAGTAAEQWQVEAIANLVAEAKVRIAGNRLGPDQFSRAIAEATAAKGTPLNDSEIAVLAHAEMKRIGGGK